MIGAPRNAGETRTVHTAMNDCRRKMSAEDLENYETDAQMALYREYKDVM